MDDGQGWLHPLFARLRDHGADGSQSRRNLSRTHAEFDEPFHDRAEAPATPAQKAALANLSLEQLKLTELAGEKIAGMQTHAPGNDAPLGGVKVQTASGWFAARPSGTEDIYTIYAESFRDRAHLRKILVEAQAVVDAALHGAPAPLKSKS